MADRAKQEAARLVATLGPYAARGIPVVGLEPSCLFSMRDELTVMTAGAGPLSKQALLFEEFIASQPGRLKLRALGRDILLHGHCHQKAFGAMPAVEAALKLIPSAKLKTLESSCCGMAGSFGYEAEHYAVSMKMAEAHVLPAVRGAGADALVVADGTSCRQQIEHGAGRRAWHVARVLCEALAD
jgi:Fe-S oxidoreductase